MICDLSRTAREHEGGPFIMLLHNFPRSFGVGKLELRRGMMLTLWVSSIEDEGGSPS
jgi:hypothetical protein